ncbi:hypothetical protein SEA_ATRAXI_6 [Microbacterium phage Atraxi]|nr:hypothetical protein SEA_ATRAXI_6 [Microbacterium phage Atraxi]
MAENIHAEERHCFKTEVHKPHNWEAGENDYRCLGQGVDPESQKVRHAPIDTTVREYHGVTFDPPILIPEQPAVLDGRAAYGNRVVNMAEQADMIRAYLSGREVQAIDVPMILILIKTHRLGKMPDYADNFDDIEGYLQIAREVIGEDMIQAATAREYAEIKKRGNQQDGRTIDRKPEGSGNPYRNA